MEHKHEFIVESCPQYDFRHWLTSNFRAVEEPARRDSVSDMNRVLMLQINALVVGMLLVSKVI